MEWEEPHDNALYCIQSDNNHMIASGSSYYGVVRLWDKRQTRCLQVRRLLCDYRLIFLGVASSAYAFKRLVCF